MCFCRRLMSICCTVCLYCCFFTLDARLLARSQYSEGPATGHLDTGFSQFPCVYKQTLRRFPTFQVATTCFSCSCPKLNYLDPYFRFTYVHYNRCHWATAHLQLNILLLLLLQHRDGKRRSIWSRHYATSRQFAG